MTKTVSITIPASVHQEGKQRAAELRISFSAYVVGLIRADLTPERPQPCTLIDPVTQAVYRLVQPAASD